MLEDCQTVLNTKVASDLFGTHEKRSKIIYRRLARAVHPDMFPTKDKEIAQRAFVKLTSLWEKYQARHNPDNAADSNTIVTKRAKYSLDEQLPANGIFARYKASYDAGHKHCSILVTKNPKNSDLANNYVKALKTLENDTNENFRGFYPKLIESFRYRTDDNIDHPAIIQEIPEGFVPFTEILKSYPQGIGGRDIAWIFKRVLAALGNAHDVGLIHGSPTLDAFYVFPEQHGVMLTEWQYSVQTGETLKIVNKDYKADYPQKVFNKEPVDYKTDLYIAVKMIERLCRDDVPKPMRIFFKGCLTIKNLEAKHLLREFDILLERLYGKPKFNEFTL